MVAELIVQNHFSLHSGGIVCFAYFGRLWLLLCVFTSSIFLKNGLRVPVVKSSLPNISFELNSKPKRNQETSSQKHLLSGGCCEIPLRVKSTTTELKHETNDQWILAVFY